MLAEFDKQYEPPSHKYISNTAIPRAYNNMKQKVVSDLSHVEYVATFRQQICIINF